jgi:prepilin-type N-terminal cleavage/methylation domain-containing protein/prepilin-type processing-associated H-X9-DG protein
MRIFPPRHQQGLRIGCRSDDGGSLRAFTLIELLVVIAVIAVLIALVFPSLSRARDKAKAVTCLSNLRQLGMSYMMYVEEQNGGHQVRPGVSLPASNWMAVTLPYHNNDYKLYFCPVATTPAPASFSKNTTDGGWGSRTYAWNGTWNKGLYYKQVNPAQAANGVYVQMDGGPLGAKSPGFLGSYAFNSWMPDFAGSIPVGNVPADMTTWSHIYNAIQNQSTTPLFMDGMWIDTNTIIGVQESDRNSLPYSLDGGEGKGRDNADFFPTPGPFPYASNTVNASWRIFVDRHNKAINVVFADGHASPLPLTNLYSDVTWYNGWVAQPPLQFLPPQ